MIKAAWESVPAGCPWRDGLGRQYVTALRVTIKYALAKTVQGEKTTSSYRYLCTLLATMANAVKERHVAMRALANDFAPLAGNQMLLGRMPGAAGEHHNDLMEQYLGASKYQHKLLDRWWMQPGFARLLPNNQQREARRRANNEVGEIRLLTRDNRVCGIYRLCRVLRDKTSTRGQVKITRMGYKWEEIGTGMQRLVLLVPNHGVELLTIPANYDLGMPGACCPRLPRTPMSRTMTLPTHCRGEACDSRRRP